MDKDTCLQKTKNIKFCAYLKMLKINPKKVSKLGFGKGEFLYEISEDSWKSYQLEFNSSQFATYAQHIESIKDLCY